jgi:hypothetical protein
MSPLVAVMFPFSSSLKYVELITSLFEFNVITSALAFIIEIIWSLSSVLTFNSSSAFISSSACTNAVILPFALSTLTPIFLIFS